MKARVWSVCTLLLLCIPVIGLSRTIIVDKYGLGQYTTIQTGINAAVTGDTVKVYPGVYSEQVNVGKNIVLQGSGYEYTRIVANTDPALSISAGKAVWFAISSNIGKAVSMTGGTVTNCVIWNSPDLAVYYDGTLPAIIQNCTIVNNALNTDVQVFANKTGLSVINTIVWTFPSGSGRDVIGGWYSASINVVYCRFAYASSPSIDSDPQFPSLTDFKITSSSPCWDTGKPDLYDPDGSRSDMGYYGGPDAPVFPVVSDLRIVLNPDGTVTIQATAQSRY